MNRFAPIPGIAVGYYTNDTVMDEDVIVKDIELEDNGDIGYTRCARTTGNEVDEGVQYGGSADDHTRWCRPQVVVFDTTYDRTPTSTKMGYGTQKLRRWLSCHELGHTFGLRHRNDTYNSCMHQYPADRSEYVNLRARATDARRGPP